MMDEMEEMDNILFESNKIKDAINKIKGIPKKFFMVFYKFKKSGEATESFIKFLEQETKKEEYKETWKKYKTGAKLDKEDESKLKKLFEKFKDIKIPVEIKNFIFGLLVGFFLPVALILDAIFIVHLFYTYTKTPQFKEAKAYWKQQTKIDKAERAKKRKALLDKFKLDHPNIWRKYDKYILDTIEAIKEENFKIKSKVKGKINIVKHRVNKKLAPYAEETDEEGDGEVHIPKVTIFENKLFLKYNEFNYIGDYKIDESLIMVYTAGSLGALYGFGFGLLLRAYLNDWQRRQSIEIILAHEQDPKKRKTLENRLLYYKTKELKNYKKLQKKLRELKDKDLTLDKLPKEKQEKAKANAEKTLKEIKEIKAKIKKLREQAKKRNKIYDPQERRNS